MAELVLVKKESFQGFKGPGDKKTNFLKVVFNDHNLVSKVSSYFNQGFNFQKDYIKSQSFESNVNYQERLLIDNDISGMSWIHLPANSYQIVPKKERFSKCENELKVNV